MPVECPIDTEFVECDKINVAKLQTVIDTIAEKVCEIISTIRIRVLLEGAYISDKEMTTLLGSLIPTEQPYGITPFNYFGTEVISNRKDIVDWVLVQFKDGIDPNSGNIIYEFAAPLNRYGFVEITTDTIPLVNGEYYWIIVRHRNHLAIGSNDKILYYGNTTVYDFTTQDSYNNIFTDGQKNIGDDWVMIMGNSVYDNVVNSADHLLVQNEIGLAGYISTDINLDGIVDAADEVDVLLNQNTTSPIL